MAFQTILKYGLDVGLQSVQTVTEGGQPSSITLQGLQSATKYYTQAELYRDGGLQSVSNKESFKTIDAGAGTVTYNSYTRNQDGTHTVVYDYTSTYAATSTVLIQHGNPEITYQGTINSSTNKLTFNIPSTNWTGGNIYLISAKFWDVYGEVWESSITSLQIPETNTIRISTISKTENTVTIYLDKIIEGGFYSGKICWWASSQDPDTDTPLGEKSFNVNDSNVVVTNLQGNTYYKFKATVVLTNQTSVYSNTIIEKTESHDYTNDYLTITNTSQENGVLTFNKGYNSWTRTFEYSTDGVTWQSKTITSTAQTIQIGAGESVMLRGDNTRYGLSSYGTTPAIEVNKTFTVSGNLLSVYDMYNFKTMTSVGDSLSPDRTIRLTMGGFFENNSNLVSAENLTFGVLEDVYYSMFYGLFMFCYNLTLPPKTIPFVTIDQALNNMFADCTNLLLTPSVPNLTTVSSQSMQNMFGNCTSLVNGMNISGVTTKKAGLSQQPFDHMYSGCTSLLTAYAPNFEHYNSLDYNYWLYGVETSGTLYIPNQVLLNEFDYGISGCPGNWTKTLR